MRRLPTILILLLASGVAGADCALPLPGAGASVADYLMQINRGDEKSVAAQVHAALFDLVEYTPMGCSDAEPDDAYPRFRIRSASRDEKSCNWLHLDIVPPGAAPERAPTPVLCAPANQRIGGWSCRFLPTTTSRKAAGRKPAETATAADAGERISAERAVRWITAPATDRPKSESAAR